MSKDTWMLFEIKEDDEPHVCEWIGCSKEADWWMYAFERKFHLCEDCKEEFRTTSKLNIKKKKGRDNKIETVA